MKKIKDVLLSKNISIGYLYFYIHMITEILCFFVLSRITGNFIFIWLYMLIYDALAFIPQGLYGYLCDKYSKVNLGIIGVFILILGVIGSILNSAKILFLVILCIGNGFIHIAGAEATLRCSEGKLSHSAIFVSGGSFGLIIGKLLGSTSISYLIVSLLGLTMIPFIILANDEVKNISYDGSHFNYYKKSINPYIVILCTLLIVTIRGYMGYGIPTSWNKTIIQTVYLYFVMGLGKALGGILSDLIGIKKVAFISILGSVPFLLLGDNYMFISLLGVMFFSMTMAVTLGLFVSVLKRKPGVAFGLTTIGLFLGTLPVFFFRIGGLLNSIVIIVLSVLCTLISAIIIEEDKI